MSKPGKAVLLAVICGAALAPAAAQEGGADSNLAMKLANPVASLISVPLQYNYDVNYGPDDEGSVSLLNVQPVWPFSLGQDWNLITRTIVPIVSRHEISPGADESGLADVLQSFFFSPKAPVGGWIVALGPVLLYPTASDDALGGEKWGTGPTALALKQANGWTVGLLTNHVVSFAGADDRADVAQTFLQPILSYVTQTKTTIGLNTESSYDWKNEQWSVPLNLTVSQLLKVGKQPISVGAGARYWAEAGENGPEGIGLRAIFTALFPK